MKQVSVTPETATLELSLEELGLIMNAIWQDLGLQEPRDGEIDASLRASYDALQKAVGRVIGAMDALLPSPDE
jgi:hypothetical protein